MKIDRGTIIAITNAARAVQKRGVKNIDPGTATAVVNATKAVAKKR
jgi:hypothetical protein